MEIYVSPFWKLGIQDQGTSRISSTWEWLSGSESAVFSLCPHLVDWVRGLSGGLFIRSLITFLSALPTWSNHLPKAQLPNTITQGVGIST